MLQQSDLREKRYLIVAGNRSVFRLIMERLSRACRPNRRLVGEQATLKEDAGSPRQGGLFTDDVHK
jgi:hypothetical protein